jgi:hypothetical protein
MKHGMAELMQHRAQERADENLLAREARQHVGIRRVAREQADVLVADGDRRRCRRIECVLGAARGALFGDDPQLLRQLER